MNLMNFALYNDAEPQKKPKKKYTPEKEVVCRLFYGLFYGIVSDEEEDGELKKLKLQMYNNIMICRDDEAVTSGMEEEEEEEEGEQVQEGIQEEEEESEDEESEDDGTPMTVSPEE